MPHGPNVGSMMNKTRHALYNGTRVLGDVNAVMSGNPQRVGIRIGRRVAGRAFARLAGGKGGFGRVLMELLFVLLGRFLGSRGRW
jgi:hypothetical protein